MLSNGRSPLTAHEIPSQACAVHDAACVVVIDWSRGSNTSTAVGRRSGRVRSSSVLEGVVRTSDRATRDRWRWDSILLLLRVRAAGCETLCRYRRRRRRLYKPNWIVVAIFPRCPPRNPRRCGCTGSGTKQPRRNYVGGRPTVLSWRTASQIYSYERFHLVAMLVARMTITRLSMTEYCAFHCNLHTVLHN